jgi:hypothetical protein
MISGRVLVFRAFAAMAACAAAAAVSSDASSLMLTASIGGVEHTNSVLRGREITRKEEIFQRVQSLQNGRRLAGLTVTTSLHVQKGIQTTFKVTKDAIGFGPFGTVLYFQFNHGCERQSNSSPGR